MKAISLQECSIVGGGLINVDSGLEAFAETGAGYAFGEFAAGFVAGAEMGAVGGPIVCIAAGVGAGIIAAVW